MILTTTLRPILVAVAASLLAGGALAAVSAEEAKKLGTTLTPVGAEIAGNKDGSIPAYDINKAITNPVTPYKPTSGKGGLPYTDPYAAEKPLFSVTAANLDQYADKLDPGSQALLRKYPSYRLDVYPTHRSVAFPKFVLDNTIKCATTAKTAGGGLGVEDAHACIPFPIPKDGYEAMWNQVLHYKQPFERGEVSSYLMDTNGNKTHISSISIVYEHQYWNTSLKSSEYFWRLLSTDTGPASKAGGKALRVNPLRMDIKEQNAWAYSPGQRRVRLAPEFKYDTVAATFGGLLLFDEIGGLDGKMDRFDFKLAGKKEMFIPYNAYKANQTPFDQVAGKNHFNPEFLRWELHRVWVVEATLKSGFRHVNSKKVFYLDEDSWNVAAYNSYDQAGKLFNLQYWPTFVAQESQTVRSESNLIYDMVRGTWGLASFAGNFNQTGFQKSDPLSPNFFAPDAMAGGGVR